MLEKREPFTFIWGFSPNDNVNINSCTPLSLYVSRGENNDPNIQPVPPYTLIAYPEQGVPVVSPLGTPSGTPPTVSWTPPFAAGTKLVLGLVDSRGNSGGITMQTYTVGAGTSTSCVSPAPSTDLKATISNTGGSVNLCDPVSIRIEGGTRPYKVTIPYTNADTAFNITMDGQNNALDWINRAQSGQQLIVAVSDSTGQYATTSSFLASTGSGSNACPGRTDTQSVIAGTTASSNPNTRTSASASSTSPAQTSHNDDTGKSKPVTGAIIGTIVAILAIFGIIAYFFFRRRNQRTFNGATAAVPLSSGFDYKRGGGLAGHDSFVPLKDHEASPAAPRMPLYGDSYSPNTSAPNSAPGGLNRQSGYDYYSAPPTTISGSGTSAVGGAMASSLVSSHQSKHQMALEEQRQQRWNNSGTTYPPAPESTYPPVSTYGVNPFGDNAYPYQSQPPPSTTGPTSAYGHPRNPSVGAATAYAVPPVGSQAPTHGRTPTDSGSGRPSGSQDIATMTPAARAKAAEAAQERQQQPGYDDDEDPVPYIQRNRTILGVTNPDRQSVATTNASVQDAYGGLSSAPPHVYQHEDAGVVELPPAYREFSRTPGPPQL